MRGSIVGLVLVRTIPEVVHSRFLTPSIIHLQSDSLQDLARKYYLTLEAIALQTRHIVDEMNSNGHTITAIYMSGGQAKNILMMQLFANTCGMPIVLPYSHSLAVVLGAAMLGRYAHEATRDKLEGDQVGERLWKIMVSFSSCWMLRLCERTTDV